MNDHDILFQKFGTIQKSVIQNSPFEKSNGTVEVSENKEKMFLTMTLPRAAWCVKNLDNKFQSLKKSLQKHKCADTAIWSITDSGQWVLHIIELKKTVTRSNKNTSWEHIKRQFVGAYRTCKMVAAALDIEFEQVIFYTGFISDGDLFLTVASTDTDSTENPSVLLPHRGTADDVPPPRIEWKSGKCRLEDYGWSDSYTDKAYTHIRVQLTESEDGTYTLTTPLFS